MSALEQLYTEVCQAHQAITDFRGKLLALVPILSGAGFTLLIGNRENFDQRVLLPVGTFGVVASVGLFCYELRGILLCMELRNRGGKLERAMQQSQVAPDCIMQGHFLDRTENHTIEEALATLDWKHPIMVPTASFLVYGAVIAGWVVVVVFGTAVLLSR